MLTQAETGTEEAALDAGPHGARDTERLCVVTRTVKPIEEMIRFVLGPDGVVPDLKRKLPGRGIWVTATKSALSDAVARKAFARGFKRDVQVAPDLPDLTERLMARATLDALAMAGKAGLVAAGFAKVEAALMRERVVAVLHASDARPDGVNKLGGTLRSRGDAEQIASISTFASAELDLALGRSNVVHAALLAGPPSTTFLRRFHRLERFRAGTSMPAESGRAREAK